MTTISVTAGRRPRASGPGIALVGALMALSPYLWHSTWRGGGVSPAFIPFHLWCWLPFALLAFTAGRIGRLGGAVLLAALMAGTVATVNLTQSMDDTVERMGLALPGLMSLAVVASGACVRIPAARAATRSAARSSSRSWRSSHWWSSRAGSARSARPRVCRRSW